MAELTPAEAQASLPMLDVEQSMQFRLRRVQCYNWGTFAGVTDIAVAERGFLFVGGSGTGKSTLLDINAVLTTQPAKRKFNVAAGGERRDRDLATYVRGAWTRRKDEDNKTALQYLRRNGTWSAVAQTYRNAMGKVVTLACVFWIKGTSTLARDVRYQFVVLERELEINEFEFLQGVEFDVRKFKAAMPEALITDKFSAYQERFRELLGIESTLALDLLHRTQTTKNMDELNSFLRQFMLDEPETFAIANTLVSEFIVLDDAYKAVQTARQQIEVLQPARQAYHAYLNDEAQLEQLKAETDALPVFGDELRRDLLEAAQEALELRRVALGLELEQAEEAKAQAQALLQDLQDQRRAMGGSDIEAMRRDMARIESDQAARERRRGRLDDACQVLGLAMPDTPTAFVARQAEAAALLEEVQAERESRRERNDALAVQEARLTDEIRRIQAEITALEAKPSNIPPTQQAIRSLVARETGLDESDLPFVGELIDVRPSDEEWQGAIERVLGEFSVAMLVSDADYDRVAAYIDRTNLRGRLRYEHAVRSRESRSQSISARSLVHKLSVVDSPFRDFIRDTLKERYNYECVNDVVEMRPLTHAVTRAGQVKRGRTSHIKDDRSAVNERRNWVLGSDNSAKLAAFNADGRLAIDRLTDLQAERKTFRQADEGLDEQLKAGTHIGECAWDDIDVAALAKAYGALKARLDLALEASPDTAALDARIVSQTALAKAAQEAANNVELALMEVARQYKANGARFTTIVDRLQDSHITPSARALLEARLNAVALAPTLETVDSRVVGMQAQMNEEILAAGRRRTENRAAVSRQFEIFIDKWPLEAAGLDTTLSSASDFMEKLERLETDGLQAFEKKFRDLLQQQSQQNLLMLSSRLTDERRAILDRLDLVNEALKQAPFNPGTYLVLEANDRRIEAVAQFQDQLKDALAQLASADTDDMAADEERFLVIKGLVNKLGSLDAADERWKRQVLDVREHVEFLAREFDADHVEVDAYDSGEGKSGGQRTKLAATCLAAALSYQLRGRDGLVPRFATVYMDEAFERTDSEFTETLMKVFCETFKLQMVVATPMKSVQTLSPYIGGAVVTSIQDRKMSGITTVEYDEVRSHLCIEKLDPVLFADNEDD